MGRYNRTCILCGKEYKFCNSCEDYEHIEPWHNIYCSDNCRTIFDVVVGYSRGRIPKEEAKAILDGCNFEQKDNFKNEFKAGVDEIMASTENQEVSKVEQTKKEEVKKTEEPEKEEVIIKRSMKKRR